MKLPQKKSNWRWQITSVDRDLVLEDGNILQLVLI